jgi:signal transduction histidine kinase
MELKEPARNRWSGVLTFLDRYSIIIAAVVIYGYYLLTSIDLLKQPTEKHGFLDYVLQFDSVILMWIVAVVLIQMQKYRREKREQEERHRQIELEFERQKIHLQVLDEITALLQDNVNNPLAIISITTHTIRRRFETDDEIIGWLDRIDASMQRIHTTINDIKAYQTQKIVERASASTPRKLDSPTRTASLEKS